MWKLVALLPCLLLVAEVKGDCTSLLACENTISDSSIFSDESSLASYADESAALEAICSELSALTTCIQNNLDSCANGDIRNKIETASDIIDYMCSDEGRQVILELAESDCNDDPLLETRMEVMMQGCVEDFQFDVQMAQIQAYIDDRQFQPSDICPYTTELGTCVVSGSAELCGPAMGSFMSSIWGIAAGDRFAEMGCGPTAVAKRHAMKRTVPLLLKRAALLKKFRK